MTTKTYIRSESANFKAEYIGTLTFRGKLPLEHDEVAILTNCMFRIGGQGAYEPAANEQVIITLDPRFTTVEDYSESANQKQQDEPCANCAEDLHDHDAEDLRVCKREHALWFAASAK